MKHIFLLIFGLLLFQMGFSQVYVIESNQPPVLKADAGLDKSIALGDSVRLGGTQSGIDGYGNYVYLWSPSLGLSNPTSANPWAKPKGKSVYTLMVTDFNHCVAMDEVQVNVSGTGINLKEIPISIQVYPNPAHSAVTLYIGGSSGKGNLSIINMLGQKVYQEEIHYVDNLKVEIDVSRWQKGLYQMVIQTDKQLLTKPIMVF